MHQLAALFLFGLLFAVPGFAATHAGAQTETAEDSPAASGRVKTAAAELVAPTVTFRQVFKGSTPEYIQIVVDQHGAATYDIRQLSDQPSPQPFQVSSALTSKIFALAADLHDFDGVHLEVRRRIANLGEKTFSYADGGQTYQVSFNYTVNSKANELLDIFQGISLEDQYIDQLHNSMRYDPLGLDDVLMRLQSDLASGEVAEPRALVPLLEKIASNRQYLDIARQRASQILASLGASR